MKSQMFNLVLCAALTSCGDSSDQPSSAKQPAPIPQEQREPIKRTSATVTATKETQEIALQRLELLKQITEVLKPLRDPAAALAKEEELQSLFSQYSELGQKAAEQGLKDRPLAALTDHLAPDESSDARAEFFMYLGIVRQLGSEQREMLDRVMGTGDLTPTETSEEF